MRRALFLAGLALFSQVQAEEWRSSDFAYGMPLATTGNSAWFEVTLPFAVYAKTQRGDLGDMRVFNAGGEMVPHAFVPIIVERSEKRPPIALPYFPLRGQASELDRIAIRVEQNGTIVNVGDARPAKAGVPNAAYVIDASGSEEPVQALRLDWHSEPEGYSGTVRVEASEDLRTWRTLADAAPLLALDYGGQKLEQKRIAFAPQKLRYLRLTWPAKQKPLALTAVLAEPADARAAAPRAWHSVAGSVGAASGEYEFDLGGAPPVDRLRVELPEDNTLIAGQLYTRARPEDPWRLACNGVFYRLRQDGGTVASPDAEIAGARSRYWMLRVDTRAGGLGGPSRLPRLHAGWLPARLLFVARGGGPFELAYGNPRAEFNGLRIESVVPGYDPLRNTDYPQASAGEPHPLGGDRRLGVPIDWKTWILWAVLVGGVTALGGMAWRLMRQTSGR